MDYLIEKYSSFCKEIEDSGGYAVSFHIYTDLPQYTELIKDIRGKLKIRESLQEEKISKTEKLYFQKLIAIQDKQSKLGIKGLNDNERQLFLVDELLTEVNNGGFDQYFTNSSGKEWNETATILEKLQLNFLADLGKRAYVIYKSNKSEDDKLDELNELDNEFYQMEYDEIYKKLLSFLR